jgi:hypothetical protein
MFVKLRTFNRRKEKAMTEKERHEDESAGKWQKVFDNVWLLFLLSLLISGVIYNAWGIYDLLHVPPVP